MMRSRSHDDAGASLLIVLIFMLLVSVLTLSLLSFTEASFEGSGAVEVSRQTTYSLDAATELGIRKVTSPDGADLGTSYGPQCRFTLTAINGRDTVVECNPSGNAGDYFANRALNAVLALDMTVGITLAGTQELFIDGRVYSKGPIDTDSSSNSLLRSSATIISEAAGDCNAYAGVNRRVEGARGTYCSAAPSQAGTRPAWSPLTSSLPAPAGAPALSCAAGRPNKKTDPADLVTFKAGTYIESPVSLIETIDVLDDCDLDATLLFESGAYYFRDVSFNLGAYNVVVGDPDGDWLTKRETPPADGTACMEETTESSQFILGGTSELLATDATDVPVFTFCAGPALADSPAIAVYGLDSPVGLMQPLTTAEALKTSNKPSIFVYGTVFMPGSVAAVALHNKAKTIFAGGFVVAGLKAEVSKSSKQDDSPITVKDCLVTDPCRSNRRVVFTARTTGSNDILRSVVQFSDDGADPAASKASLVRWSLLQP